MKGDLERFEISSARLVDSRKTRSCSSTDKLNYLGMVASAIFIIVFTVVLFELQDKDNSTTSGHLVVKTEYGYVQGFEFTSVNWNGTATTVDAWRGIPFATPPVGNLRWRSPIPPAPWDNVLNCTTYQSPCIQSSDGSGSEDCLYINVYSSQRSPGHDALFPVLFYIYGGGLMSGEANANFNYLIYADVDARNGSGLVVVEVAYRLNLFGFLATSQLSAEQGGVSGNYGIQDQIMALNWVQRNILAFGGDKNNVILAGQSSGGTSIFALMSSAAAAGLFSGALSMSGSTNLTMPLHTAEAQNEVTVALTGCNLASSTDSEVVSCMRAMPASAIYDIIPNAWNMPDIWGLPLGPGGQQYQGVVIVDGVTIPLSFADSLLAGTVDVPLMLGNMGFEPDEDPQVYVAGYSTFQWHDYINQTFSNWTDGGAIALEIWQLYLNDSLVSPQKAYDRIVADYGLFCGQIQLAQAAASAQSLRSSSIYLYYDEWALTNVFIGDGGTPVHYAYHDLFYFELTGQWNLLGNGSYIPQPEDLNAQHVIQNNVWNFFLSNSPLPGWTAAATASTNDYNIFVIQSGSTESGSVVNFRDNVCRYFATIGLTRQVYWWSN